MRKSNIGFCKSSDRIENNISRKKCLIMLKFSSATAGNSK